MTPIHLVEAEDKDPDVRLSSPVYQAKKKPAIEVDKSGEPFPSLPATADKSAKETNSKVVLNTMSISLFDNVGLKSTTFASQSN